MKWNGRQYRPANAQYITKKKNFDFQEALKPYGEKELPVWSPVIGVNNEPSSSPVPPSSPTPTPSNTPTGTPNPTTTPTPSTTAQVTPTPTQTNTPTTTTTLTLTPTQTSSPTPTPSSVPFTPSGVTNLQLWYMSNSGATISSWTNYGLLGGTINQGVADNQPQIITGTLGSYTGTTVQFTSRDFMSGSITSTNFSSSTVFAVMKLVTTSSSGWSIDLYGSGTNNNSWSWQSYNNASTSIARKRPGSSTSPTRTKQPLLLSTSGTSGSFFTASYNDVLGTSGSTTYTGNSVTNVSFGYEPGSGTITDIYVFEFLAYNRVLTSTEYNNVVNYLKTKYQYNTW